MMYEQQAMKENQRTPPYVEYHAFKVFLEEAKKRLPERVTVKYLRDTSVAKSSHRTLIAGLRSLNLIDSEGKATLHLASLLKEGGEFTDNLKELVTGTYGALLAKKHVQSLSRSEIGRYFQDTYGLSERTAYACASFFVRVATDAKLLPDKRRTGKRTGVQGRVDTKGNVDVLSVKADILSKLPDFKDGWKPAEVQLVLQEFEKLLSSLDE